MKAFKIFLSTCLILGSLPAFAQQEDKKSTIFPALKSSVEIYNSLHSANRLFAFMKLGADKKDASFIDSLNSKLKAEPLPRASVSGDSIYLQGLGQPLKMVDLAKHKFSYRGQDLDFSFAQGIETSLRNFEPMFFPSSPNLLNLVLPQAHAMDSAQMLTMLSGAMAVGGLAAVIGCMANSQTSSSSSCKTGGFMGMLGMVGLMVGLNQDDQPKQVNCTVDGSGMRRLAVVGPNGLPLTQITQYPGQSQYTILPAVSGVSPQTSQYGAGQMMSMCNNPSQLGSINSAMAQPMLYPMTPNVAQPIFAATPTPVYVAQPVATQPMLLVPVRPQSVGFRMPAHATR